MSPKSINLSNSAILALKYQRFGTMIYLFVTLNHPCSSSNRSHSLHKSNKTKNNAFKFINFYLVFKILCLFKPTFIVISSWRVILSCGVSIERPTFINRRVVNITIMVS